jgi:hypothetical protein
VVNDQDQPPERPTLHIAATQCRYGPVLSRPSVGDVIGFVVESPDAGSGIWITGDTG